jgi:hypothetical protein
MTDEHLTTNEIRTLMQGLDALQAKEATELFTGALLGAALARDKEEAMDNIKKDQEKYRQNEEARIRLGEQIILLKAKLLRLRDAATLHDSGTYPGLDR